MNFPIPFSRRLLSWLHSSPLSAVTLLLCVVSAVYWLALASERYVSESRLIVQSSNLPSGGSFDLGSLLTGGGGGSNRTDQLLLREYLRSPDMAELLDKKLALREHFNASGDWISKLWFADASPEFFYRYYLQRVQVEYDEFAGVLVITAQAFEPQMAQKISRSLLIQGELFMNQMAHSVAQDQVNFLEAQVRSLETKVRSSRLALLEFQERKGLISPEAAAQAIAVIVANLQGQLVDLQTQRSALQAYLVADHPSIVLLSQRIDALEKQLALEKDKLAAPGGKTLNRTAEAFAQLELQSKFELDMYKTALTALEQGRLEATRTLKKVAVVQQPNLPERAMRPRRIYQTSIWVFGILLMAGIAHLLLAIVKDHRD